MEHASIGNFPNLVAVIPSPSHSFSLVPELRVSHEMLGASGEVEFKGETKYTIHMLQEIQTATDLVSNLTIRADIVKSLEGKATPTQTHPQR